MRYKNSVVLLQYFAQIELIKIFSKTRAFFRVYYSTTDKNSQLISKWISQVFFSKDFLNISNSGFAISKNE